MSNIETVQISLPQDSYDFLRRVSEAANVTVDQACSVILALSFVRDASSTPAESGTVPPEA